jgi:hypothetical protein
MAAAVPRRSCPHAAVAPKLLLAGALSVVVCLGAWLCWFMLGSPVAGSRAAQVREGMTRDQVRALLGRPKFVAASPDGPESWVYDRHTLTVFLVRFSPTGAVTSTDFDEGGGP